MINLLQETLEELEARKIPTSLVHYVVDYGEECGSWEDFEAKAALINYDDGWGTAEISSGLKIVGCDWWLERAEYDGSEWWEFKTLPTRPLSKERKPLGSLKS